MHRTLDIYIRISDREFSYKNDSLENVNSKELIHMELFNKKYSPIGKINYMDEGFIGQRYVYPTSDSGLYISIDTGKNGRHENGEIVIVKETTEDQINEALEIIKSIERI